MFASFAELPVFDQHRGEIDDSEGNRIVIASR
jgi:hypothetical protein